MRSVYIAVNLASALQYLHNLGIVHRDVKPANILLDRDLCPHLADFGLAEYKHDLKGVSVENWKSLGKPTGGFHKRNMVGTLIYMAPELLKKEVWNTLYLVSKWHYSIIHRIPHIVMNKTTSSVMARSICRRSYAFTS